MGRLVLLVVVLSASTVAAVAIQPRMIATAVRFTDVTAGAGVRFVHTGGSGGRYTYIEQFGGGAAFFDYDGDGWLDLFLAQAAPLPGFTAPAPAGNVLYRNKGDGTFADVTEAAGLRNQRYTIAAATADYDDDGDTDLAITTLEGNQLYRNEGNGKFVDVTVRAGVGGSARHLGAGAAFVDVDRDGRLDLFVARYARYDVSLDAGCPSLAAGTGRVGEPKPGQKATCTPRDLEPTSNLLFRNRGDGTFEDVSAGSGLASHVNHGLGIATADYNEDGWTDVFVASDQTPNLLFINRGDGTFEERAHLAGVAVGPEGRAYAGMGVDAGDYDGDGHIDLFITNLEAETSSLYRGAGDATFSDESRSSGITGLTRRYFKWGCRFVDLDYDMRPDIFVVNGHVNQQLPHYRQRAQFLRNADGKRFEDLSVAGGAFFQRQQASRAAAFADYDNDGDTDVLITNNLEAAILLRNDTPLPARSLGITLRGEERNRDALGAVVRVTAGTRAQIQVVKSGGSYLSDHDRRLRFALPGTDPAKGTVRWPCGLEQTFEIPDGTSSMTIEEKGCRLRAPR